MKKDVDTFFGNLATPLVAESTEQKKLDNKQRRMLGTLIAVAGVGVMTMFVLPNPMWGRLVFVLCGLIVFSVGLLLVKAVDDKVEGATTRNNRIIKVNKFKAAHDERLFLLLEKRFGVGTNITSM